MKRIKASVAFWALWYLSWAFVMAKFNPLSWDQDIRYYFLVVGWGLFIIFTIIREYETA